LNFLPNDGISHNQVVFSEDGKISLSLKFTGNSADGGSVLLKEEIQPERWYWVSLPISNRSMVGGLGSQEDVRRL